MIWKKIQDYNYSINENGEVRNDKTGRILKNYISNRGYFYTSLNNNNKQKAFTIHRLLAKYFKDDYSEELDVDHIDRNRLNNNLENLRMVTRQENLCNVSSHKDSSSKYKGVYYNKRRLKWHTSIYNNGKKIHLGYYNSELEAAQAYKNYIYENNLEYYSKNEL